jgi:hypothetical protein
VTKRRDPRRRLHRRPRKEGRQPARAAARRGEERGGVATGKPSRPEEDDTRARAFFANGRPLTLDFALECIGRDFELHGI